MKRLITIALIFFGSLSFACMTGGGKPMTKKQSKNFFSQKRNPSNEVSKFAEKSNTPQLEANLGNLLLEFKSKNVVLSLPAKILKSTYSPFPDKQTNAKMTFGDDWKEAGFPVVGIQETTSGEVTRRYVFHKSLNVQDFNETKLSDGWFKVQPKGWVDSFYFNFESAIFSTDEFLKSIPEKHRTFSGGRLAPNVAKISKSPGLTAFKNLGEGFNIDAWDSENVHGRFPNSDGIRTAIGGVKTWGIVENKFGPFKYLYTCFEARNKTLENEIGAPSGAGWHFIGDPAESLLNTLENQPLPVATGRSHTNSNAAYGLSESITATWLESDHVFVSLQDTFHWYLNPYESAICTELWVHNCVPNQTNSQGFNCQ